MNAPTIEDTCTEIAQVLQIDAERCTPDAVLTDLVADSFRLVEMAIEIQDSYDVIFGQEDMQKLITVADLHHLISERVSN